MERVREDIAGNRWSIQVNGDRVELVLVQPVDDRDEPRRIYFSLSADDARELGSAFEDAARDAARDASA